MQRTNIYAEMKLKLHTLDTGHGPAITGILTHTLFNSALLVHLYVYDVWVCLCEVCIKCREKKKLQYSNPCGKIFELDIFGFLRNFMHHLTHWNIHQAQWHFGRKMKLTQQQLKCLETISPSLLIQSGPALFKYDDSVAFMRSVYIINFVCPTTVYFVVDRLIKAIHKVHLQIMVAIWSYVCILLCYK